MTGIMSPKISTWIRWKTNIAYRSEEFNVWGEEGEDEGEDGVAHGVEGGGWQLIVVVHVVAVALGDAVIRLCYVAAFALLGWWDY